MTGEYPHSKISVQDNKNEYDEQRNYTSIHLDFNIRSRLNGELVVCMPIHFNWAKVYQKSADYKFSYILILIISFQYTLQIKYNEIDNIQGSNL